MNNIMRMSECGSIIVRGDTLLLSLTKLWKFIQDLI